MYVCIDFGYLCIYVYFLSVMLVSIFSFSYNLEKVDEWRKKSNLHTLFFLIEDFLVQICHEVN